MSETVDKVSQQSDVPTGQLQLGEISPLHTPAISQLIANSPPASSVVIDISTSEVSSQPDQVICNNKPEYFCYICGRPAFIKKRRKPYVSLINIYEKYFNRMITDLDEWWTPNFFCSGCTCQLYNWENGRLAGGLPFAVPMIWRKPSDDHSDCYFCKVPKAFIFGGPKYRRSFQYPEEGTTCVDVPIEHSEEYPIPERITTVADTTLAISTTTDEDSQDTQQVKTPELFTPEDLERFLKDLSPLNQSQKDLLTSVLYMRNLVAPIVPTTRARTSGKRKSYVFATPSPKRLRPRVDHHQAEDVETIDLVDDNDAEVDFMEDDDISDSETPNDDSDDSDYEVHDSFLKHKFEKIITVSLRCLVDDCTVIVQDKKELDSHLADVHLVQKHRCLVLACRASFKSLREFRGHLARHHPEITSYPCGRCIDRSYTNFYALKKHIFRNHLLGHFRCGFPDCDYEEPNGFFSKMTSHQTRVHTEKHLKCPFEDCPRAFVTQSALNRHEKTHTGEKLFDCTYCSKSFATDNDRVTHTRSHTGDMPFVCHICGKAYPRKGTLHKHLTMHQAPGHRCTICGKTFNWEDSLKKHMNLHLGVKPHECPNCGKRFTWPSNLAKHRRNQVCTAGDGRKNHGKSLGSGEVQAEVIEVHEVTIPENIHLIPELQFHY